ncbi:hypothetical protein BG011_004420 [Mortierella polycephala]|uniref:Ras guanine nucleotide exchange factor domain-containing protein n=1 Tax=Mortierella polycephala TaxID=41804 RepID=A0A9P6Q0J9_9FUNG|nr:hypothetical protein BG011_004420 [Mortierella polycephala]
MESYLTQQQQQQQQQQDQERRNMYEQQNVPSTNMNTDLKKVTPGDHHDGDFISAINITTEDSNMDTDTHTITNASESNPSISLSLSSLSISSPLPALCDSDKMDNADESVSLSSPIPNSDSSINNSSNNNANNSNNIRPAFLSPNSTVEGSSSATSEPNYHGSRRSSKDSCESTPGTSIEDLVDQLTIPDYANPQDQIARTKIFLMIYRRFMRPRELLEMFIERFEELGDIINDEHSEANNTRLRICSCLYYWLKHHPNDIMHRQTRQRVTAFLKERVALFPYLNTMYVKLVPLASIQYFNTWRAPRPAAATAAVVDNSTDSANHSRSRSNSHNSTCSSSGCSSRSRSNSHNSTLVPSAPTSTQVSAASSPSVSFTVSVSDEDLDTVFLDVNDMNEEGLIYNEEDMDEDREWGMIDEDEVQPESDKNSTHDTKKNSLYMAEGLAPFAHLVHAFNSNNNSRVSFVNHDPPRDRRSSTGSFASPCAMETFVTNRRGSTSSVSSNPGPFTAVGSASLLPTTTTPAATAAGNGLFSEGDSTSMHQTHHPVGVAPYINKRSSSQAYRQHQRSFFHSQQNSITALAASSVTAPAASTANVNASATTTRCSTPVSSSGISTSITGGSELSGPAAAVVKAAMMIKEAVEDKVHPLHGHQSHQQQQLLATPGHHGHHLCPSPVDHLPVLNVPFIDIKDKAIAEQLTCVEYGFFKKLKPRDMLRHVWKTKKGSAALQACIAHFNFISSWVGTMILLPAKAKHRAKMMEKFISIAKILRDMGNYNTTMAIIGAMNTSSIHRLVQTRELLQGKEIWNTFKELEHLMSSVRSFYEYRSALKSHTINVTSNNIGGSTMKVVKPCIPYLGVHLGDLLSTSEGNKDFRQDGTLHWQKFVLMADVVAMVMTFQQDPGYNKIHPDPFISRVITDTRVLDDEELYIKSVGMEPSKLNHSRSISKFTFF